MRGHAWVHVPSVIKLFQTVLKDLLLLVLIDEGIPLSQSVELIYHTLEELAQGWVTKLIEGATL